MPLFNKESVGENTMTDNNNIPEFYCNVCGQGMRLRKPCIRCGSDWIVEGDF